MTEARILLLVVGLVYLWECILWVPRGCVAFRAFGAGPARIFDGNGLPGITTAGALLGDPFPPFGIALVTSWLPVSLAPEGAYSYVGFAFNPGGRPRQAERYARFNEMRSIEARDRDVLINGEPFARASSAPLAAHVAGLLRDLRSLPALQRASRIEAAIADSLDTGAIRDALERCARGARSVRWLAAALLAFLFLVTPVALLLRGLVTLWPWLLGGVLALAVAIAWRYAVAHRKLFPGAGQDRWSAITGMILCPPTAIRAPLMLSRDLLATHHPMAVASAVSSPEAARSFALALVLDARHPVAPAVPPDAPDEAREVAAWFHSRTRAALEAYLETAPGGGIPSVLPPPAAEYGAVSYCPRCRGQYRVLTGSCTDCGGLPLTPLSTTSTWNRHPGEGRAEFADR